MVSSALATMQKGSIGRNLVLLLTSAMLAALLDGRSLRLSSPARLAPDRRLPAGLDHFVLRFVLADRSPHG